MTRINALALWALGFMFLMNAVIAAETQPSATFKIEVVTGTLRDADTNAKVFITLYGEKNAESGEHRLDGPGDDFERGALNIFNSVAQTSDLSRVSACGMTTPAPVPVGIAKACELRIPRLESPG